MKTEKKGLELFGDYGSAWRRTNSLSLNRFGKSVGLGENTFVGMVERMEEEHGKFLVPRALLKPDTNEQSGEIANSYAETLDKQDKPRTCVRVTGLTPFGHAITDFFVLKRTMDALYELLLETRELPAPHALKLAGGASLQFGGDTPENRSRLARECAGFLAKHAVEFGIVGEGLRTYPASPAKILERHAEAAGYRPMTPQEIADYHNELGWDADGSKA